MKQFSVLSAVMQGAKGLWEQRGVPDPGWSESQKMAFS